MRALCVDDDTEIQEVMKLIFLLHWPDATVATADDGHSALHQVLRERVPTPAGAAGLWRPRGPLGLTPGPTA